MKWVEIFDNVLEVEITKEQASFLEEYVSNMSGGNGDKVERNYKKDFILKKEHEDMIQKLHELFYEKLWEWADNQQPDPPGEVVGVRSKSYETRISIFKEDNKFFIELGVSCQGDCYYDDDDRYDGLL